MKEEILFHIVKKLYHNHLTPEVATNLLLDLFAVSGQSEQIVCDVCKQPYTKEELEVGHCFNYGEQEL